MKRYWLLCLLLLVSYTPSPARQAAVRPARTYTFVPETVFPMGSRPMRVTATFQLVITRDKVTSYLPYFGSADAPAYGNNNGPGDFTLLQFDYSEEPGKKGATIIRITPRDKGDVRRIEMTYFPGSAYADVSLIFNRRQSIRYRGQVTVSGTAGR
ncbi:DUF4251 domain-containing protein [Taibaiella chishuiensis]|uniref:Uncharacterized protein DUF4251 n=1 Tax=Taibaiella chishuiensis TaxID=1434707 RepID=A0A2P8D8D6_9BACT|nr:DUF4251 domain-containing protein [Taibaiella chishuiensis]PSK93447.1 uncharacterized protein DUF4251 [Taibaiella chishuiensis]